MESPRAAAASASYRCGAIGQALWQAAADEAFEAAKARWEAQRAQEEEVHCAEVEALKAELKAEAARR